MNCKPGLFLKALVNCTVAVFFSGADRLGYAELFSEAAWEASVKERV